MVDLSRQVGNVRFSLEYLTVKALFGIFDHSSNFWNNSSQQ